MNKLTNTYITLCNTPEGFPEPSDFIVNTQSINPPAPGQILCKTQYLSLDPYMRSQISGRHLSGDIKPGDLMQGETVSKVIKSTVPEFAEGDLVRCFGGWQALSLHEKTELTKLPKVPFSASAFLSTLGTTGLTAYAGIVLQAKPTSNDVVVISAATGGVGATACQLAKLAGCKVIGIAGGQDKCNLAVNTLGYDACIDRKNQNVSQELKELCPEGINVYFDLAGGELLNIVSEQLAIGARVILCGIMSELNGEERTGGPHPANWIKARAIVTGLVVYDYEAQRDNYIASTIELILQNKLKPFEEITKGIENAPSAFCRLMRGENKGKVIIKLI